jgi:hypothetical protein
MIGGSSNITFNGTGTLASNTLTIVNSATTILGGALTGPGGLNEAGAGTLVLPIANTSYAGTTTLTSGALVVGDGMAMGSGPVMLNGGIFQASRAVTLSNAVNVGGAATVGGNASVSLSGSVTVATSGSVHVAGGTSLTLMGGGNSSGMFVVDPSTTLSFSAATFTFNQGSAITGPGLVQINGGTVAVATAMNVQTMQLDSGTLSGPATLTATGTFTWTGGTMSGAGMTMIAVNAQLIISDPGQHNQHVVMMQRRVCNAGTETWSGEGGIWLGDNCQLVNEPGGLFDAQSDDSIHSTGGTPSFMNQGILQKSGVSNTTMTTTIGAGVMFSNPGTLQVQTGRIDIAGGFTNFTAGTLAGGNYVVTGTLQFTGANIVRNAAAITLDGTGQILDENQNNGLVNFALNDVSGTLTLENGYTLVTAGDFINAGTLAVVAGSAFAGTGSVNNLGYLLIDFTSLVTIGGDYTQASAATLEIQLGGVGLNGQLTVGSNANLDGTLTLTPVNGYTPSSGDAFQIITFASRNGTDFANPPAGFNEVYDDVGGSLTVVAQ